MSEIQIPLTTDMIILSSHLHLDLPCSARDPFHKTTLLL